ncbi:DUF262 domain-containing protein [Thermospira aquatica]|uniref:DUF262 domain-containing protein n=1 Tax=Thermospira aquatica TaxID=2828656 RepID=A0AAX3BFQ0_9SPIR|nr:DUF262 domain-containing HNH endonuclease family protein [Thermospira aquatica]URA10321.1 DUF262 domain-containing protein [Thermospira aquatica]
MKTESHSINDVLAKNATSFFIPPFQRAYAWGKPEIERFFSDISRIIESELDANQQDKQEHFFGTIVIKEEKAGFANKSVIIDGQQRLTTTLLFLIALRDTETDPHKQEFITNTYLINNSSTFQDKIKLKQVTKDWEAYKALVNKSQPNPGIISNAYELLKKLINEKRSLNPKINFEHFIIAIQRMNVAVIFLDERPFKGEDPQIIFETLNSLGKPLTLSDLVRNFVLLNMESNNQSDIYEKTWYPKIEEVLQDYTSEFFRDYLQYKTASSLKVVNDSNTKELYQQFKDFVENKFTNHNEFIDDIIRYVKWYKWIINETNIDTISKNNSNDKEIKELLRNIFHDIKSEAFKPFVLGLLEYHQYSTENPRLNDELLISILKTIRTYLIRRRVLGLTQGENKNIVTLCNRINDIATGKVSMIELLTNMFYKLRLPNDSEMEAALRSMNFYEELKQYSKFILGKIEEHNTKVSVDFRDQRITIEHIMPQKLDNNWKAELGKNYEEIHKKYLHNIGNLILTEFNSEIGNKSFNEKKMQLNQSSLNYRLDIINRNVWNEQSIIEHQKNMIKWFLETFPLPDQYKDKNNWNTNTVDPDPDANVELHIFDKIIEVNSWQDVFIKFLKYVKESPNYDFDNILNNQYKLFKRDDVILKWSSLKKLIESNRDLENRYKTFDGKTCCKVKDPNDDLLFVHINISASTCISRIATITEEIFLPSDSIKIKLK